MSEKITVICENCESELKIVVIESDFTVQFCPMCGEELDLEDDD